jgi:ATP-dependent DNA ligase
MAFGVCLFATEVRLSSNQSPNSRWNQGKENVWHPLKPKLVVEVCYDQVTGNRFRHGAKLLRWRPDKPPEQCKRDQLAQKKSDLLRLLK